MIQFFYFLYNRNLTLLHEGLSLSLDENIYQLRLEKLKQIEGERPDKQDGHQGISGMPEDVP